MPVVEGMPVVLHSTVVPTVGEGSMLAPTVGEGSMLAPIVDGAGLIVAGMVRVGAGTMTDGLTPKLLISKDPNGIPAGETPPGTVGDVGDVGVAVDGAALVEVVSHIAELASAGAPTPVPPPSYVVLVPDIAGVPDMAGDEVPSAEHVVPVPIIPIVPAGAGLRPGEVSPVAPNGIPVPGTGAFPESAIWARAVPLNRSNVAAVMSASQLALCAIPVLAAIGSSLSGAPTQPPVLNIQTVTAGCFEEASVATAGSLSS
jgi:hypothetical protein